MALIACCVAPIARMLLLPAPHPGSVLCVAEVAAVLWLAQPQALTGGFALTLTRGLLAVLLPSVVAHVGGENLSTGQAPLKLKDIWAIRVRLQIGERTPELALFNLAIDSKLRSCDLVKLRVRDVCHGSLVAARTMVMQQKTQRPVQFEITEQTRESLLAWIRAAGRRSDDYLFPSRIHGSPHLSTRQYARIVSGWVREIGLDSSAYGTHTMRRTKASLIYRRTKNLRVVQLLLGHTKLESTVRYLGIEVDDALEMAEQTEV
jgi:integrase